jgi:hypothetical protein
MEKSSDPAKVVVPANGPVSIIQRPNKAASDRDGATEPESGARAMRSPTNTGEVGRDRRPVIRPPGQPSKAVVPMLAKPEVSAPE